MTAPLAANASSFGKLLHLHPGTAQTQDAKVTFVLLNKSAVTHDVAVEGHTYKLLSHQSVSISALPGAQVTEIGASATTKATVLFVVDRTHKGTTVYIN